ncbi:MAG: TRAP transporter large permease subunit [Rhodobiaceae bacterium]|nr:TRAP transporter large permease subunit [Rhodobiaceae bacterium]MCC0019123.1 TRAP transporter large permease subunit [Rhodobiaceae bacterium]MCC0061086.1 TRAP transporter large permease subunit [Rhodobiaceae bacterium]
MTLVTLSLLLFAVLFALLAGGVWIAITLGAVGFAAMAAKVSVPAGYVLAISMWQSSISWDLTALPMFIWMGEILYRSRLSEDLFDGLAPWLGWLPGRMLHINVAGCTVFAAVSGSSAATCATVGRISLPELAKRGYDERLAVGTLAGAGTLGLLIPPSIILIVYAAATEQSIARLFIAGVLPGLMLSGLFMGLIMARSIVNPRLVPADDGGGETLSQRLKATWRLLPVLLLIIGVIGSIYGGLASATEAAVVGVGLSLLLSWFQGSLTRETFSDALLGATRTSCMIAFILAGAAFLTSAMGYTGLPRTIAQWIGTFELARWQLLCALTVFFVIMGCFLDGISMVVLTTSVIMPMVEQAGLDLIWFGIFLVLVVEMAQITPPIGFNLYVLQGLTGRNILWIARAAAPFFMLLIIAVVLIAAFPQLATWLPQTMLQR